MHVDSASARRTLSSVCDTLRALQPTANIYLERVQLLVSKLDDLHNSFLPAPVPSPATPDTPAYNQSYMRELDTDTQVLLSNIFAADSNYISPTSNTSFLQS